MEPQQVHNGTKPRRKTPLPKSQHSRPVTGRFEFRDRLSLGKIEQPQWLVGYFLRRNSYALLYGKPEAFKSLFALDMALSIGAGRSDCLGLPIKAEHNAALYLGGEDLEDFGRRVRAWEAERGAEASGFHHVFQVPEPGEISDFIGYVPQATGRDRFDLIIVDTVIDGMAGLNEDSARDMASFNVGMMQLGKELGGTVLAIHHAGKAAYRGERGSSALRGKVRTAIKMDRKGDTATVKIDKQNSGESRTEFAVELHKRISPVPENLYDVTLNRCDASVTGEKASRALKEARNYDASISSVLDKLKRKDGGYTQKAIAEYLSGKIEKIDKPGEYISVSTLTKGGWLKGLAAVRTKTAKHYADSQWRGQTFAQNPAQIGQTPEE